MAKQPEEWHYLNPEFDNTPLEEEEEEEIIWVSKSEIKRDAEALKKLGTELVELSAQELERVPLDEKLLASIKLAQRYNAKRVVAKFNISVSYSVMLMKSRSAKH